MNALILVDLQNDFTPSGALPVPEGDSIVPLSNQLQQKFDLVVATQDWHPSDHQSFAIQHEGRQPGELIDLHGIPQVLWPVPFVQETEEAQFIFNLDHSKVKRVFHKGQNPRIDSYSGFFDNDHQSSTGMGEYLRELEDEVFAVGLATDYCVHFTATDATEIEFRTIVISDATRGVNLQKGDVDRALVALQEQEVRILLSSELPRSLTKI
ncbi:MAG TPA: bifunctional nicotinamidase/pyrazinamidase [Deltaproteobacteria bacterium]|nr:bifunctional nicotinamidase/pyrazinamidase [Deltaproteobacteria bacterium]